jgi:glycosyltransferase involved in cell wall biosynthesis
LKIAVPWGLSHYIPLNGFHPLYRALFDHVPAEISLEAWDNVKLHRHFASDRKDRDIVLNMALFHKRDSKALASRSIAHSYASYFYPPERVLTEALPGDIEFHHTAPFPSLTRPFVFHCESFAPVFFPLAQQGHGSFDKLDELRRHYKRIFASPLCQGIYSHIPGTLDSFRTFFSDADIDRKLFGSRIGLSNLSVDPGIYPRKSADKPRFLFINSAHQQSANFFNRGGHIVLRFWKEFRAAGREGKLILRCGRPDDSSLASHGVDPAFVRSELGRSILWAEGYLANHEINALMADAHFFLLPSASLHSASILLAMTLGTIPVLTDTLGTSVYVTDRESAIVLKGVRDEIWHPDPRTGVLVDHYERMPNVATSLVAQLVERVLQLLDSSDAYMALSQRTAERARKHFSGETFASDFWDSVNKKALITRSDQSRSAMIAELTSSLGNCTIDRAAWSRVFESATQPMPLLDTGTSTVYELGGAAVHIPRNPGMALTEWSVFAQYFSPGAPETTFATTLACLGDLYLVNRTGETRKDSRKWRRLVSNALMPYPNIHSFASRQYRAASKAKKFAKLWLRYIDFKRGRIGDEDYTALVMESVHGFNVIRSFHKYYAIPQAEGAFIVSKAEKRQYSRTYCAYSLERAVAKVNRGKIGRARMIATLPIVSSLLTLVGEHRVRAGLAYLSRKRGNRE